MIQLYIKGLSILGVAIVCNICSSKIKLKSWYDLLNGLAASRSYWKSITVVDGLWLFLIYPLLLGFGSFIGAFIYLNIYTP
jgi:hypothetical protein